jgi:hypothetical protein
MSYLGKDRFEGDGQVEEKTDLDIKLTCRHPLSLFSLYDEPVTDHGIVPAELCH